MHASSAPDPSRRPTATSPASASESSVGTGSAARTGPDAEVTACAPSTRPIRWRFLDVLRGFALLGILLVNSVDITMVGSDDPVRTAADPARDALYLTVQTRFVPMFVFLFGMSVWFVLSGARQRAPRPWAVVLRRLLALGLVGGLLMVVYPGNVLLEYAVVGLLVVPAVLFAPRWAVFGLGAAGTIAAYALFGGGLTSLPGLMLLGFAAAAYGLPQLLDKANTGTIIVAVVSLALSMAALAWQLTEPGDPRFTTSGGVAGLMIAVFYVTVLSLLWATPVRVVLAAVFEPLGKMALSNYIGAAIIFWAAARLIDFQAMTSVIPVILGSVAVVAVQSVSSRLWLATFRYGPFEWVWRVATWWKPVALRRGPLVPGAGEPQAAARGTSVGKSLRSTAT